MEGISLMGRLAILVYEKHIMDAENTWRDHDQESRSMLAARLAPDQRQAAPAVTTSMIDTTTKRKRKVFDGSISFEELERKINSDSGDEDDDDEEEEDQDKKEDDDDDKKLRK